MKFINYIFKRQRLLSYFLLLLPMLGLWLSTTSSKVDEKGIPLSITDATFTPDGEQLLLACKTSKSVQLLDAKSHEQLQKISLDEFPTGVLATEKHFLVTSSYDKGYLNVYNKTSGALEQKITLGMGAKSPIYDAKRNLVYTSNRFQNTITAVDLNSGEVVAEVGCKREPFDATLSADGNYLFVNNFLPAQRADIDVVTSEVSVIDLNTFERIKDIPLANGSNALRASCLTADGKYLLVSHNLGRFTVPTSQLQQGWMNTSAFSIIDATAHTYMGTVLVDEPEYGAAGVWGIACDEDHLVVTHSGTHDYSLIDYKAFIEKFENTKNKEELSYDLRFFTGIRKRLPITGNGPRICLIKGKELWVPTYFTDNINVIDLETESSEVLVLNPNLEESQVRRGERLFNDASQCFQGWQSCNGCHPGEARTDGMNWDLLNDGIGNPKNCKSMLYSHQTPPAMISGIRPDAETAVKAGFEHIQFAVVEPEVTADVSAYLSALRPLPSPYLEDGELSELAKKGKKIFQKNKCSYCHSGPLYTDMKKHKVGDVEFEGGWDTPTLREVWRTAPYLHDGKAYTIEELFGEYRHGLKGKKLKKKEVLALAEYVKSL